MTTEKMNVHKALAELKILDDRIVKAINSVEACISNKHSNTKVKGVDIKVYTGVMKSSYDKATDLIKRREAIKRAVVLSNAVTKVTVADKEYTVAEAIEMKNHGMDFKELLKQKIKKQYDAAMAQIITENGKLEDKAENYVVGLYGSKEGKTSTEEFTKTREAYIEAQTMELVDPIGVLKEMEDLETEIAEFTAEVDAALSVSNSLTEIEITY
jgi:hypothetical protein